MISKESILKATLVTGAACAAYYVGQQLTESDGGLAHYVFGGEEQSTQYALESGPWPWSSLTLKEISQNIQVEGLLSPAMASALPKVLAGAAAVITAVGAHSSAAGFTLLAGAGSIAGSALGLAHRSNIQATDTAAQFQAAMCSIGRREAAKPILKAAGPAGFVANAANQFVMKNCALVLPFVGPAANVLREGYRDRAKGGFMASLAAAMKRRWASMPTSHKAALFAIPAIALGSSFGQPALESMNLCGLKAFDPSGHTMIRTAMAAMSGILLANEARHGAAGKVTAVSSALALSAFEILPTMVTSAAFHSADELISGLAWGAGVVGTGALAGAATGALLG